MLKPPNLSLCIGKRGSGKTELTKKILEQNTQFIVYDINREYDSLSFDAVPVYYFDDLKKLLLDNEPRIIFKPKKSGKNSFEYFCCVVWNCAKNYFIVVEEINNVMERGAEYSRQIVDLGRHKNLGLHGTARRPLGLDKLFMSQVDAFFIGRTTLPNDLKYYAEFIPADAVNQLFLLPKFSFVRFLPEPERLGRQESEQIKTVINTDPFE